MILVQEAVDRATRARDLLTATALKQRPQPGVRASFTHAQRDAGGSDQRHRRPSSNARPEVGDVPHNEHERRQQCREQEQRAHTRTEQPAERCPQEPLGLVAIGRVNDAVSYVGRVIELDVDG